MHRTDGLLVLSPSELVGFLTEATPNLAEGVQHRRVALP